MYCVLYIGFTPDVPIWYKDHPDCDSMIVGFTTTCVISANNHHH